ncbi:MAG: SUMF1/EgtB/PvdO family nonheme iron enzyme [Syntrophobacterales bacterium]
MPYRAFISYSHAADGKLAPALQSALHRFAKPWYRLRAIHVFRDETSLSVTPALWPTIEKALGESEYFILMASPEAAASHWVRQEVDYWLKHVSAEKILIVLTEGEIVWDDAAGDFDWSRTTALPENLKKTFTQEPLYLDLRWAKQEEHLSLNNPKFNDAVAELAATLHGRPKDEITGEDVRQHRRTKRIQWAAVLSLLILTVASVVGFFIALYQYRLADERGKIALSRQLAGQSEILLDHRLDLSLLLSVEAFRAKPTLEARSALFKALMREPQLQKFLYGHTSKISSLNFSADGKILASGDREGSIRLWDAKTFQTLGPPLKGHQDLVYSLAFSPDGHILASCGYDLTVRLWDVKTHEPLGEPLTGHDVGANAVRGVWSLAFSPNGKILSSGGGEGIVYLWDVKTLKPLGHTIRGHESIVSKLAFSPNGNLLASGGEFGIVRLWNVRTIKPLRLPLKGHQRFSVSSLAFSPNGKLLASGDEKGTVRLWDVNTFRPLGPPMRGHREGVQSTTFSHNGETLTCHSFDGSVRTWSTTTHKPLKAIIPLKPIITGYKVVKDNDKVVKVGRNLHLAFSPDSKTLALGAEDGTIRLINVEPSKGLGSLLTVHRNNVWSITFSPSGKILASSDWDGFIHLWNARTFKPLGSPLIHDNGVWTLAFSPDNKTLASGGKDGKVRLWDLRTRSQLTPPISWREKTSGNDCVCVGFNPDGNILAYSTTAGLMLLDTKTWKPIGPPLEEQGFVTSSLAFSPNGKILASGGTDRFESNLYFWDTKTFSLQRALKGAERGVESLVFSPDGKMLASGSWDGRIRFWDSETKEFLAPLITVSKEGGVISIAFSPDGKILAAGGSDGSLSFWDTKTRVPFGPTIMAYKIEKELIGEVNSLAFNPDGKILVSGGGDGEVRVWDMDEESWVDRACRMANRNLTQNEWEKYLGSIPYHKTCPDLPKLEENRTYIESQLIQGPAEVKNRSRTKAPKTFTNSTGMKFVLIPAGTFMMGNDESYQEVAQRGGSHWWADEHPQHQVTISQSFYLQTTEVTQGQWQKVMGDNPSRFKKCGKDCPVERVSWHDAQKFIKKLNRMEKTEKYRLPTEAEWEYACRAGSTKRFCFGDKVTNLSDYAWYDKNSGDKTHPVGQKKPNGWGLYDVHGNVAEWCQDWYGDYPTGPVTDPLGPVFGGFRVFRGGSYLTNPKDNRPSNRGYSDSDCEDIGFRVVRTLK